MDLFSTNENSERPLPPLAERLRPETLDEFVGQEDLVAEGKILANAIRSRQLFSMIFWGPPGTGKTTLAKICANAVDAKFFQLSAVSSGVKDVRKIIEKAELLQQKQTRTILFIDEIHRFNKAQQDALLHAVEDGSIVLIGATTENPSFEVISPLLSRCRVLRLHPLKQDHLKRILERALKQDVVLRQVNLSLSEEAEDLLLDSAAGDGRRLLNVLEIALQQQRDDQVDQESLEIAEDDIREALQHRTQLYDKKGDYHYDTISAFIKSIRGSDPDAAIYWLAVMLEGGEDPKFIARRLIISASEDIGNADPYGITLATSTFTAIDYVGMPEAAIILAQATTYLASTPKSNESYMAINRAMSHVRNHGAGSVPLHIRNAPTDLMKSEGYHEGYDYPHDHQEHFTEQQYLPDEEKNAAFYHPSSLGREKYFRERLSRFWSNRYQFDESD
ncbi:MAG: replication-associated recombination protein A [Candidatus Marinimicrobia bacterium]|nr:replication-associated recombination protein A [Candidatus Neomarinimicrobiota bacterium]MCF7829095.1 replication-associated recombination protein A [Candidatus Neomarinimicrobiota bacterium]MCF7881506.1 replication-associated recombination protein A [Candidatus Neomarinimicrobiota bacterium]